MEKEHLDNQNEPSCYTIENQIRLDHTCSDYDCFNDEDGDHINQLLFI